MKFSKLIAGCVAASALAFSAVADPVDDSFFPYADGTPSFPGLEVGMTINASNVDQFAELMDPEMVRQIKEGWWDVKVGETTSFDLSDNYIQATRDNSAGVSLGDKVGQINGFVSGRPFVGEPDASDDRAGEKLAWNYKYGYNWGDNAAIAPFYWKFRDMKTGKVERTIKFVFNFLNMKHRTSDPVPEVDNNPDDIFRAIYMQVLEPFDLKNTQLLIYRYDDDLKSDSSWLYLGFQRRVRRLATGQTTDAFLGSDLMIEDFEGYNGRISDMNWTYKGTVNRLLPFFNHNEVALTGEYNEKDGYQFVDFGGKGGCFPNVTWQLRKTYVLESQPVDKNHPISKRVHYVDAQTFTLPRTLIYDRKGDLWKTFTIGQAHPDSFTGVNKGSGVSVDDAVTMVDVQAMHCTTAQFKGLVDPSMSPQNKFTVQNMRATGR